MTDLSRRRRPPHPETQALLLAAAGWGGAPGPEACRPPRAERVAELVHFAREEGLGGLLFALLRRRGLDRRLPDEARRFLEGLYHRALAGNVRRLALLEEIGRAFAARGVSAVLIQGMALLFGTYPDPGWRPVTDVDLWAPERKAAEEALRALGFAVANPRPLVLRRGGRGSTCMRIFWARSGSATGGVFCRGGRARSSPPAGPLRRSSPACFAFPPTTRCSTSPSTRRSTTSPGSCGLRIWRGFRPRGMPHAGGSSGSAPSRWAQTGLERLRPRSPATRRQVRPRANKGGSPPRPGASSGGGLPEGAFRRGPF